MTVISTPYFRSRYERTTGHQSMEYSAHIAMYFCLVCVLRNGLFYRHTRPTRPTLTGQPTLSEKLHIGAGGRPKDSKGTDAVCRSTEHLYVRRAQTSAQTGCFFFFFFLPTISHSAAPLCKCSLVASRCLLTFNV